MFKSINRVLKFTILFVAVYFVFIFFKSNVLAATVDNPPSGGTSTCGTDSSKHCDNSNDCANCCGGNTTSCSYACNVISNGKGGYDKVCAWDIGDSCTNWVNYGECIDHCQGQVCADSAHPYDYQIISCGGGTCGQCGNGAGITCGAQTCCGGASCCFCGCKSGSCSAGCCDTHAPKSLLVTQTSPTSATITWSETMPSGSSPYKAKSQRVYVGTDLSKVTAWCPSGVGPGTGCVLADTKVPLGTQSYNTGNILSPNTLYYYEVIDWYGNDCNKPAVTESFSSCEMSPSSLNLQAGQSAQLETITQGLSNATVSYVDEGNSVSFNPSEVHTYVYTPASLDTSESSGNDRVDFD